MPKPSTKQLCPADLITAESFPYQPGRLYAAFAGTGRSCSPKPARLPGYRTSGGSPRAISLGKIGRRLHYVVRSIPLSPLAAGTVRKGLPPVSRHGAGLRSPPAKAALETWLAEQGLRFEGGETNAPARIIPLRYAAVAAGWEFSEKNNFFYGEKGSYYELEGYLIDQPCEYTHECRLRPCADSCTLCQKACRTKALSAPYTMNPLSCTSFWTTFGQGAVPPHLTADQFTTWLCGCDACQDVCPYNRHDWSQGKDFPGLQELEPLLQPETIVAASDAELCDKVIPKTDLHISPDQVQTSERRIAHTSLFEKTRRYACAKGVMPS